MRGPFLTAAWRHLLLVNYEVPPEDLASKVPAGTSLDTHDGRAFVSLVGFRMLDTRLLGVPIPFHRDFDEVNLRFYVRRGDRRAVAFVKEIVPRPMLAWVPRLAYGEPYVSRKMWHRIDDERVEYAWAEGGRTHRFSAAPDGAWRAPEPGSHEHFILDHLWGYCAQRKGPTIEYEVEHPPWRVRDARGVEVDIAGIDVYGELGAYLQNPISAFFAEGSDVAVARPRRI